MDDFLYESALDLKPMHPRAFRLVLERMLEDGRVPLHFSSDLRNLIQPFLGLDMGVTLPPSTLEMLLETKDQVSDLNALILAILEDIQEQLAGFEGQ